MVEYTLGVGRAATAAPAMKKAGEATAATFKKLGETLGKSGQAQVQSSEGLPVDTQWLRGPLRMGPFADPATIVAGLTLNELLNRYGDPVMKTPGGLGTEAGDTYWYRAPGGHILAEVRDGKVAVVTTEAQRKQRAAAGLVIVQ
jgi:hypothetical protein